MAVVNSNAAPIPEVRFPVGFVSINGTQVKWERFEITKARYASAGTFSVTLPASALPQSLSLGVLVDLSPIVVRINAGLSDQEDMSNITPSYLPQLIIGEVDELTYDPLHSSITLSGRDFTAPFLDNKLSQVDNPLGIKIQTILNYSVSSDIITLIANYRGLKAVVTPTTTSIGTYFAPGSGSGAGDGGASGSYTKLSSQITEWDLMVLLAKEEGFNIYVDNDTVYFNDISTTNPYRITLTVPYYNTQNSIPLSNTIDMQITRNMRLAKNVVVQVTSWNIQDKIPYTSIATQLNKPTSGSVTPLVYNYRYPNLTQAQCQIKAEKLLKQISQHQLQLRLRMPADTELTETSSILVKDTNSGLDQIYYVNSITREMDFNGGFIMSVDAKTTPPSSTEITNAA